MADCWLDKGQGEERQEGRGQEDLKSLGWMCSNLIIFNLIQFDGFIIIMKGGCRNLCPGIAGKSWLVHSWNDKCPGEGRHLYFKEREGPQLTIQLFI